MFPLESYSLVSIKSVPGPQLLLSRGRDDGCGFPCFSCGWGFADLKGDVMWGDVWGFAPLLSGPAPFLEASPVT